MTKETLFNELDFIIAYEDGALDDDEDEIIYGFQHLIDSGIVWKLQGHYGRTAQCLIDAGYCHECEGK